MPEENIVNDSKNDPVEAFLQNIEEYPHLKKAFEKDALDRTGKVFSDWRNMCKAIFKTSFWDDCKKESQKAVFEEGKYVKQYEELKRKENEIIMEKEEGKKNSMTLSDIEKNLYKENGEKSEEFSAFYEKVKTGIKNEHVELRYFPTTAVEVDLGMKINSEELWEGCKRRIGTDREHYYTFPLINNELKLNKVNPVVNYEDSQRPLSTHIELTDNDFHNNKYFTVSFFNNAAVLFSFFQHLPNRQDERIQLAFFLDDDVDDIRDVLKKNPSYMLGLLKEVSAMFPIDLYNCIKEKYSLFGNIGQYEKFKSKVHINK